MVATTLQRLHSVTMVFWKETAFPFWRAMDRHWNRNAVSLLSSVTVVMRLPSLVSALWQVHVRMSQRQQGKNMSADQPGVLVHLVLCCILGCAPGCIGNVKLSIRVYSNVTSHAIGLPLAQGKRVVPFGRLLSSRNSQWLFDCRYLCRALHKTSFK